VFDIDGVVLRLEDAISGSVETLAALRERGLHIGFITNNATRTPSAVVETIRAAGIDASPDEVVTSAVAASQLIEPGTRCLVIGMEGLVEALRDRGCVLVVEPDEAETVVVGWDRTVVWDDLRRATLALAHGARFMATNADVSYQTKEGPWPGNGAIIAALSAASGRTPEIAGKPQPALFHAIAQRLGDGPLLMVGDRPETDLAGAAAMGWDTALVLTGVTGTDAVDRISPRPTWVLDDLRGLLKRPPEQATHPGPIVRSATAADTDTIISLWKREGMHGSTLRCDLAAAHRHSPDLVLVLELSRQVVGVLLATFDGRRGWLQHLAIDPTARRRGFGRLLVTEAERRLAAHGAPQVNLLVLEGKPEAEAFWDAMGYEPGMQVKFRSKRLPGA
jgi:glycerol 3-phosphatase-2